MRRRACNDDTDRSAGTGLSGPGQSTGGQNNGRKSRNHQLEDQGSGIDRHRLRRFEQHGRQLRAIGAASSSPPKAKPGFVYECFSGPVEAGFSGPVEAGFLAALTTECITTGIADADAACKRFNKGWSACPEGGVTLTSFTKHVECGYFTGQCNTNYADDIERILGEVLACEAKGKDLAISGIAVEPSRIRCGQQQAAKCQAALGQLLSASLLSDGRLDPSSPIVQECSKCTFDFLADCTYVVKPTPCCSDGSDLCYADDKLSTSSVGSYQSRLTSTQAATLEDRNDTSKQGQPGGNPAPSRFAFDRRADCSALSIKALYLTFNDFIFDGQMRKNGSAILAGNVTAAAAAGDPNPCPNTYAIPAGAAKFSLLASDDGGNYFSMGAINETPLTISELDSWLGPQITGTLTGSLGGHTIEARLKAVLAWDNRPPVAVATVSNVDFHSSQMEPCKSTCTSPPSAAGCAAQCVHRDCQGVQWIGLKGATAPVRLDGSASYDPDGDSLLYSWSLKVENDGQPVGLANLPTGDWAATLEVKDPQGATSVASAGFHVRDLDAHLDICYAPLRLPKELKPKQFGNRVSDPDKYLPIESFDYSQSDRSIVVSAYAKGAEKAINKAEIKALDPAPRNVAKVFKGAKQPDFGFPGAWTSVPPDPFADACSNPGASAGASLVCTGYCGNRRCDKPYESCSSCPGDCGPCTRCGDGRCDATAGETCSSCQADCGECNPCGNGRCEAWETITSCTADCYCGDGLCEAGETPGGCAQDCYCGNSTCDAGETAVTCPNDCRCGDRTCDASETVASCPADCTCGNGVCDPAESSVTCAADCFCGDGRCDVSEDAVGCPTDCPSTRVFVTSAYTPTDFLDGNLGGIAGADALCQSNAAAAGLTGTFKAWLSDGASDPASTFTQVGPYVKLYGTSLVLVANDWADLTDGTLASPIDTDAFGNHAGYNRLTNVNADGTTYNAYPYANCSGFTSNSCSQTAGYGTSTTTSSWSNAGITDCCTKQFGLICFEQ
jgi:hypothetical protein